MFYLGDKVGQELTKLWTEPSAPARAARLTCSAVQCSGVQSSAVQRSAVCRVACCAVQYSAVCSVQKAHTLVLHTRTHHCTALQYCTTLHSALHCTAHCTLPLTIAAKYREQRTITSARGSTVPIVQCCAVQCSAVVQRCAVQYSAVVQRCAVQCRAPALQG